MAKKDAAEDVRRGFEALETQIGFLKQDFEKGERGRVIFALQSLRFLASRIEELLTKEKVEEASLIAHGPNVVKQRVDGRAFHNAIVSILDEAGGPISVKEIMGRLEERGIGVPGQGRPANVIAHLGRMPEVRRTGYGQYQLARTNRKS